MRDQELVGVWDFVASEKGKRKIVPLGGHYKDFGVGEGVLVGEGDLVGDEGEEEARAGAEVLGEGQDENTSTSSV